MKLTIAELTRRATILEQQKISINITQAKELVRCLALEINKALDNGEVTEAEIMKTFSLYLKKLRKKR